MKLAGLVFLAGIDPVSATSGPAARPCEPAERARLLAPATPGDDVAALSCSLRLSPEDRVSRRLVIAGAGATGLHLDCNGATIGTPGLKPPPGHFAVEIRSTPLATGSHGQSRWSRPSDVSVSHCTIHGHVRIWGMGVNGQGEAVRASSRSLGHTERAQEAAPTRVRLADSQLIAQGAIPFYLGPGVTESGLSGSQVTGRSSGTAVYLDAESARNTIESNTFDIETGREVVAVDGSAHNRIVNNRFVLNGVGGIHLYRNCGEGGTVRHQTPSDNLISGNRFKHKGFFAKQAVVLGSREGWRLYCGEDAGYPFGSSLDNGDHAERNRVEDNVDE